jgi:hypothetical protein
MSEKTYNSLLSDEIILSKIYLMIIISTLAIVNSDDVDPYYLFKIGNLFYFAASYCRILIIETLNQIPITIHV